MSSTKRDEVLERFRTQLNAPPPPPLEAARSFLLSYVLDADSMDEVEQSVDTRLASGSSIPLQGLIGIEALLQEPPSDAEALRLLVVWETSWYLEDNSEEGAKAWLKDVALMLRRHLKTRAPRPPEGLYARDELEQRP